MSLDPVSSGDPHVSAHNAERSAINQIAQGLEGKISLPGGALTGDLLRWDGTQWATTETRFFEGNGRPDGNFAAPVGSRYIDKTAVSGAVEWVKRSGGDSNLGWMCLAGDTGLKDVRGLVGNRNGSVCTSATLQRIGSVVSMHLDLTMPTSGSMVSWQVFTTMAGYSPGINLYAGLQDNGETANTGGTVVEADGGVVIYTLAAGKRDRYYGTWLTRDPWP